MRLDVAKYGDLPLLVSQFSDVGGRDWVTQSPSRGDDHQLQERGRRQRRTTCELIFCDQEGQRGDYLERWLAFKAAAESTTPALFRHPLEGSYVAVVVDLQGSVSLPERAVRASCTFVAAAEPAPRAQPTGAGVTVQAGPEAVDVAAARATAELDQVGVASSAPAACRSAAGRWASDEAPVARSIAVEAASLAAALDDLAAALLTSLGRWQAYRSVLLLRAEVLRAADAATTSAGTVYRYTVQVAEPLRSLIARLYGAAAALELTAQVARDNGLRSPGWVAAGTVLTLPVVSR